MHDGNFSSVARAGALFGAGAALWHTAFFPSQTFQPPAVAYEFFIGLRYTRAKRRNHFISFISLISVAGIALGMTVLITVLSVMNGFQREIRTRILGVASHVQLSGADGTLSDWKRVAAGATRHDQVLAAAPFVVAQGLLTNGPAVRGAFVRGVAPEEEDRVADIGRHMKSGDLANLKPGEYGVVLGVELARALGAAQGDRVVLVAPQGQVTPAGVVPRLRQFTVAGIFGVDHYEYDSGLALIHIEDAQRLFRLGDAVSGVRLKIKDLFQAPQVARELSRSLSPDVYASDWTRQHANFFRAVQIEKRMMFIVIILIIAVAAFNIVSSLVMVVTDKQADIAILRTLGAAPSSITRIFMIQGTLIGVVGTLLGLAGGIALALNVETVVPFIEGLFGIKFLAKDVYYITDLPSELQMADVVITAVVAFALSLAATIYPSWRASRISPAEALRYE
jgi:lipoprotein-releasing system permease protein